MDQSLHEQIVWQKIINITPDSFSDGGENYDSVSILGNIRSSFSDGVRCFDFGAQSTAPGAASVSLELELERFKSSLVPLFKNKTFREIASGSTLSFDTFRPETIKYVMDTLIEFDLNAKHIIWNDISGIIDTHSIDFLSMSKNVSLILSHNLANFREESNQHYLYKWDLELNDFLIKFCEFFKERLELIPLGFRDRVIIDPCFGFSKSSSQNIFLLKNLASIFNLLKPCNRFMVGISRKRFVRELSNTDLKNISELDMYGHNLLKKYLKVPSGLQCYVRSHRCFLGKNSEYLPHI